MGRPHSETGLEQASAGQGSSWEFLVRDHLLGFCVGRSEDEALDLCPLGRRAFVSSIFGVWTVVSCPHCRQSTAMSGSLEVSSNITGVCPCVTDFKSLDSTGSKHISGG